MAEKEGFEPSIPLWGIHDFQSCALDRATRLLHDSVRVGTNVIILRDVTIVNTYFLKSLKFFGESEKVAWVG